MTLSTQEGYLQRSPHPSSLYDVLDLILDKGLVIDLYVRVSLVGIELLTIDARIVVASVDTYLRFAEAVNRLDISESGGRGLPEFIEDLQEGGAQSKTKGALQGAKESLKEAVSGGGDRESSPRRSRSDSKRSSKEDDE
jgi:gas vesicle structural protein